MNRVELAINYTVESSGFPFKDSWIIEGNPALQKNDKLRITEELLSVIFQLDRHNNIIIITAYSENDD